MLKQFDHHRIAFAVAAVAAADKPATDWELSSGRELVAFGTLDDEGLGDACWLLGWPKEEDARSALLEAARTALFGGPQ